MDLLSEFLFTYDSSKDGTTAVDSCQLPTTLYAGQ